MEVLRSIASHYSRFNRYSPLVCQEYSCHAGAPYQPDIFDHYGESPIIRRAIRISSDLLRRFEGRPRKLGANQARWPPGDTAMPSRRRETVPVTSIVSNARWSRYGLFQLMVDPMNPKAMLRLIRSRIWQAAGGSTRRAGAADER